MTPPEAVAECIVLVREAVRIQRQPRMPRFTTIEARIAWAAANPAYRTEELDLEAWYRRAGEVVDALDATDATD